MEENKTKQIICEMVEVLRKHDLTVKEADYICAELFNDFREIVNDKKF